jgi:hypothetical protein
LIIAAAVVGATTESIQVNAVSDLASQMRVAVWLRCAAASVERTGALESDGCVHAAAELAPLDPPDEQAASAAIMATPPAKAVFL